MENLLFKYHILEIYLDFSFYIYNFIREKARTYTECISCQAHMHQDLKIQLFAFDISYSWHNLFLSQKINVWISAKVIMYGCWFSRKVGSIQLEKVSSSWLICLSVNIRTSKDGWIQVSLMLSRAAENKFK